MLPQNIDCFTGHADVWWFGVAPGMMKAIEATDGNSILCYGAHGLLLVLRDGRKERERSGDDRRIRRHIMDRSLSAIRKDYNRAHLTEVDADESPVDQFRKWFDDAMVAQILEPTAMTLATADRNGRPSARIVLLKGFDTSGFLFFTNYESKKGQDLGDNPCAAIVFFWPEFERQVRVEGLVEKLSPQESDSYFQSRPRESRLSSWASRQDEVIPNREVLDRRFQELLQVYSNQAIPRPLHWGGYRLVPSIFEFWQGGPHRLHDRLRYRRTDKGPWLMERLSP
jgi:pyridoxamine 5'-phosphate oxidase